MHLQPHKSSLLKYLPLQAAFFFPFRPHFIYYHLGSLRGLRGKFFSHQVVHPHCTAHLVPWQSSRIAIDSGNLVSPRQPPLLIPRFSGIKPTNPPSLQRLPSYALTQLTYLSYSYASIQLTCFHSSTITYGDCQGLTVLFLDQSGRYLVRL